MKWLAIAALLGSGCFEDDCDDGESVCGDNNKKLGCHEGSLVSSEGCCPQGTVCMDTGTREVLRRAACSASGVPDPRCEGVRWQHICDGNTLVKCEFGFSSGEEQCGACVWHRTDSGMYGVCATAATDARCARFENPRSEGCDGSVLYTCDQGALVYEKDCGALGASCREIEDEDAQCFVANDPMCDGTPFDFCEDNVANICTRDRTRIRRQCGPDQVCHNTSAIAATCGAPTPLCE